MEKQKKISFDFWIDNPNLYRIAWRDKSTGESGCGLYSLSVEAAQAILWELDMIHNDYSYWIEKHPRVN